MVGMPASIVRDYQEQFEECLGLISTSISEAGPFHPLFRCPLQRVRVEGPAVKTVLLIEFNDVVVALFPEARA